MRETPIPGLECIHAARLLSALYQAADEGRIEPEDVPQLRRWIIGDEERQQHGSAIGAVRRAHRLRRVA